jgi:hypothetical protein
LTYRIQKHVDDSMLCLALISFCLGDSFGFVDAPTYSLSRYLRTSDGGLRFDMTVTAPAGLFVDASDRQALSNLGTRRTVVRTNTSDLSSMPLSQLDKEAHQAVLRHLIASFVDLAEDDSSNGCNNDEIGCMTATFAVQRLAVLYGDPSTVLNLVCPGGGCLDFSMLRVLNNPARNLSRLGGYLSPTARQRLISSIVTGLNEKSFTRSTEAVFFQGLFPMLASIDSKLQRVVQSAPERISFTSPTFVLGRELAPWVC